MTPELEELFNQWEEQAKVIELVGKRLVQANSVMCIINAKLWDKCKEGGYDMSKILQDRRELKNKNHDRI